MSLISVEKADGSQDLEQREQVYRLIIVVAVGALIATLVAVVWLVQGKNSAQDDADDAREQAEEEIAAYTAGPEAQTAAEEILGVMTTYDYRRTGGLADRWTRYLGDEELKEQYENELIPDLVKAVKLTKTVAVGEVETSAYNLVDEDHVNVYAYVRQRIKSKDDPKGVLDEEWFSIDMVRVGDDWLVEQVHPYDVPPPE